MQSTWLPTVAHTGSQADAGPAAPTRAAVVDPPHIAEPTEPRLLFERYERLPARARVAFDLFVAEARLHRLVQPAPGPVRCRNALQVSYAALNEREQAEFRLHAAQLVLARATGTGDDAVARPPALTTPTQRVRRRPRPARHRGLTAALDGAVLADLVTHGIVRQGTRLQLANGKHVHVLAMGTRRGAVRVRARHTRARDAQADVLSPGEQQLVELLGANYTLSKSTLVFSLTQLPAGTVKVYKDSGALLLEAALLADLRHDREPAPA